jgi:hypothetical protein
MYVCMYVCMCVCVYVCVCVCVCMYVCMYKVNLRRVGLPIVASVKQYVVNILCVRL